MVDIQRIGSQTDTLGEGPVWCPRQQALYWVDIRQPTLRRLDPAGGRVESWQMPELVGSLALAEDDRVLVALSSELALFDLATGAFERIARPQRVLPDQRFNDGKCDRQGRFWVGSMNNITRDPEGVLYCLDPHGKLVEMLSGIRIPNSLAWSPDGRTMYFADSLLHTIHAYAFDPATGTQGAKRLFARTDPPAIPDGGTVDRDGYLWSAEYDGWRLTRYAPDGRIDRVVELPVQRPTSCMFGGPSLDILYVTTAKQRLSEAELARQPLAGALLALDVGVRGLPEPRFNWAGHPLPGACASGEGRP